MSWFHNTTGTNLILQDVKLKKNEVKINEKHKQMVQCQYTHTMQVIFRKNYDGCMRVEIKLTPSI